MSTKSDIPDIPPEKLARKPLPLTAETADLLGEKKYMADGGETIDLGAKSRRPDLAAIAVAERAEKYSGPEPLRGLKADQIATIKALELPDMPKMDAQLGDRTEAYRNALWARAPWYAAVRYAYRLKTWPTKLPASWPPKRPVDWLTSLVIENIQPAADPALAQAAPAAPAQVMVLDGGVLRPATAAELKGLKPAKGARPPRKRTASSKPSATATPTA